MTTVCQDNSVQVKRNNKGICFVDYRKLQILIVTAVSRLLLLKFACSRSSSFISEGIVLYTDYG